MEIAPVAIPVDSLAAAYPFNDYADAFVAHLRTEDCLSPDDLLIRLWTSMPGWVLALLKLRAVLVKPFGLKSGEVDSALLEEGIRQGKPVGLFSFPGKKDDETLCLLSDKHLDALLSAVVRPTKTGGCDAYLCTKVKFHNRLGRLYFCVIRPFHCLVVRSMLRRACSSQFHKKLG